LALTPREVLAITLLLLVLGGAGTMLIFGSSNEVDLQLQIVPE
jgi:hypothetical protein